MLYQNIQSERTFDFQNISIKKEGLIHAIYHFNVKMVTRSKGGCCVASAAYIAGEKINYELLGMGDAHLHWHLFPRVSGDIGNYGNNGRGPVWWYPMEKMYSDDNRPSEEQLADMKRRLLDELEKLI